MRSRTASPHAPTPLGACARGLLAGMAGTAAMTAAQLLYERSTGGEPSMMPARIARRIIGGVFHRAVDERWTPVLNNAMHWSYGTGWGAAYGLLQGSIHAPFARMGMAFGAGVWSVSLLELPAMQLAPPIWETPPAQVAPDISFHLIYGLATAGAYAALRG